MSTDREKPAALLVKELDAMASEFCDGAFKDFGISPERMRDVYVPVIRELLENAAMAALRSYSAPAVAEGWQPIETAPKDGTRIDLWVRGRQGDEYRVPSCRWSGDTWAGPFILLEGPHTALNWRPLPPPPAHPAKGDHES